MKKIGCCLVLALGAGCVELPLLKDEAKPNIPSTPASKPVPPAVEADQVTEANADEKAAALREELERDAPLK